MHVLTEKKKKDIVKLFELIKDKWEAYLPLEGTDKFVIFKTVCSQCNSNWYVDEKECFSCKLRYLRALKCISCGNIIAEENIRRCPKCKSDVSVRGCLNCDEKGDGQFVPITFCTKCGNREHKFEFKLI